ncbi:MAG TPA: beta-ketoacyl synthase N-terminal-like domain-containing protein, partial [Pyrinomonadaceae bacterium]
MRDAVIVSAVRTAVGKAPKGTLKNTRPDEMGAAVIEEAVRRAGGLEKSEIEDVIMGCAMPEAEQGMNVARAAAIRAGLPVETSAMTINRFCSSGLQSIALAADRIRTGACEVIVAGGLETMSLIPMGGHIIRPNPYLVEHYPDFYLNMGLATENVARKYEVSREEQDAFALLSHRRAAAAQDAGKFEDEIVPLKVTFEELDEKGRKTTREVTFARDEGVRRDSSEEGLAKLRPAFHAK